MAKNLIDHIGEPETIQFAPSGASLSSAFEIKELTVEINGTEVAGGNSRIHDGKQVLEGSFVVADLSSSLNDALSDAENGTLGCVVRVNYSSGSAFIQY